MPWNDPEALLRATEEHAFAAILAEPFAANMGLVAPAEGFLDLLRERASATGALLVFDEVITGFRVARGGAQELAGVMPDLTIMGKVMGGGLPAAAYGGPRALMELVAPAGDVYQAGTLSGNPLAVAAGLATLQLLDERAYACLTARTETLAAGLREAAGDLPVHVVTAPGLLTVFFSADAGARLRGRPGVRPRRLRRLVPRPAGPRRLRAAVAVRGVVPVAGARGRARRAHGRRRRGGLPGGVLSVALAAVHGALLAEGGLLAEALGPAPTEDGALGRRRRGRPALARPRGGRRLRDRGHPRGRAAALRRRRASSARSSPISRSWRATGSTRWASRGWRELGDVEAVCELADVIALCAQARAEERPELADAVWQAGVAAVGWGASDAAARPPRPPRAPAILARRGALQAASREVARYVDLSGDRVSPRLRWPTTADRPRASTPPTA